MSNHLNEAIFRAYDIRGVFGDSLDQISAREIGRAIGTEVLDAGGHCIALGRDGRHSGEALLNALAEGIQATGCEVMDLGMVPTPVVYFATCYLDGVASGVMVTGSHNPPEYNGFKIVVEGVTLHGERIQALRERIERADFRQGKGARSSRDMLADYLAAVTQRPLRGPGLKVVVDCGNGVAGVIAPEVFRQAGHEVIPLFAEVDGDFPNHHPDPGDPENLRDLIAAVREHGADIGLAFDGDGDRLGVVLPSGEIVYPDILLMALAEDLLSRRPGARVLFDVKCTGALFSVIRDAGGVPEMARTGHSLIKARMKESGALLAGEMSGHIFMAEDWYGFDDAMLAGVRLLAELSAAGGDAVAWFGRYPVLCTTPEITIPVTDENKFRIVEYLQNEVDLGDGERTVVDGIRMDYADGWGLCRASNTSPKLVTRYEARDEKTLQAIRARFEKAIAEAVNAAG